MKFPFLLGRIIFGGFFLYSGIDHLRKRKSMAEYAGSKKVPAPEVAVTASGVLLMMGGASIMLGIKPRYGALSIAGFLAGVSPFMHDFWNDEEPNQRMNNMINFMKNAALLGGAVMMLGMEEPWPASVPIAQENRLVGLREFVKNRTAA